MSEACGKCRFDENGHYIDEPPGFHAVPREPCGLVFPQQEGCEKKPGGDRSDQPGMKSDETTQPPCSCHYHLCKCQQMNLKDIPFIPFEDLNIKLDDNDIKKGDGEEVKDPVCTCSAPVTVKMKPPKNVDCFWTTLTPKKKTGKKDVKDNKKEETNKHKSKCKWPDPCPATCFERNTVSVREAVKTGRA